MVGFGLVAFSLVLFVYYTLWIIVLVRVSSGHYSPSHFTLKCLRRLCLGADVSVCLKDSAWPALWLKISGQSFLCLLAQPLPLLGVPTLAWARQSFDRAACPAALRQADPDGVRSEAHSSCQQELKPGSSGGVVIGVHICSPPDSWFWWEITERNVKRGDLPNLEPAREEKSLENAALWKSDCESDSSPASRDTSAGIISGFLPGKKYLLLSFPGMRGLVQPWADV